MQRLAIIVFVLALCLIPAVAAQASMRCGNLIVQEGTNGIEIQAECGDPVAKERHFIDK
ncbi:MAG: DUF2845 domain-containing protein [Desulfobacterales bacterium]|jgi:hypothetical protein